YERPAAPFRIQTMNRARDELLAGSCLAADEDREVAERTHLEDPSAGREHHDALADDPEARHGRTDATDLFAPLFASLNGLRQAGSNLLDEIGPAAVDDVGRAGDQRTATDGERGTIPAVCVHQHLAASLEDPPHNSKLNIIECAESDERDAVTRNVVGD